MELWLLTLIVIVIAAVILLIPRYLYVTGRIDEEDWLTIMIGVMGVLTLLQVILLVLKAF